MWMDHKPFVGNLVLADERRGLGLRGLGFEGLKLAGLFAGQHPPQEQCPVKVPF